MCDELVPGGGEVSETVEVSVDEEGQILIPEPVSARLGLSPGMALLVEQADDGCVRLRSSPLLAYEGGVLVLQSKPVGDLTDVVKRERDARVEELVRQAGL
jgi:bifunctional DNA-binding transcriptional regulator/antitoxin component of YhaV-PrlF toxin-antitoxin module